MQLSTQRRNRLLAVLFLGVLMAAMDIAIVGPALPSIRDYFGVDDRAVSWVFTLYLLPNLIGTPLMAKLSDTFGRRVVYTADVLLFVIGSIVVATAPSFGVVLLGRALQGFGAGGIFPVASAVIGDTFPPDRRGSALGLIGAVFGVAFLIGPILGGILLAFGWQWLFLGPLPLALLLLPAAWWTLPTTRAPDTPPFDALGALTLSLLLGSLTLGLNRIQAERLAASLRSTQVWPFLALALLLLPLFVYVERRAASPIVHLRLFGTRQSRLANSLALGAGLVEGGLVFIPALLVGAFAVTESRASFMLLPLVLAMAIGSPLIGRALDRWGSKLVIILGTSLLSLGGAVLSLPPLTLFSFYLAGAFIGVGLSAMLGAPLRYIMIQEAPVAERASAQALISILTKVGQMVSGTLIGGIAASFGGGAAGYLASYRFLTILTLLLVLTALGLKSRRHERQALAVERATASGQSPGS